MINLKAGHLVFESSLVAELFGNEEQVNLVYYPERNSLLLAARSKTFFEKLHKTSWTALKLKNPKGDKSLFIRDLLIDHDIDSTDRPIIFNIKNTGIVEITL